jgi:HSP20 family protein
MTISRRAPQRTVVPLRDALDWLFDDSSWNRMGLSERFAEGAITLDMRETDDAFVVEAELPGIKPEDVEVTLEGRTLAIRGRYTEEREGNGKTERYLLRERRTGQVMRVITLPAPVDADNVTSTFDNGELEVSLPKAKETRARRISVGSGAQRAKSVTPGGETKKS